MFSPQDLKFGQHEESICNLLVIINGTGNSETLLYRFFMAQSYL